jgi:imidazolonepropionase
MTSYRCRIRNATQLVTVCNNNERVKTGSEQSNVAIIKNGSIIINDDGRIVDVGSTNELDAKYQDATFELDIDATGKSVIPGLVDSHTHPVWTGDRTHEFAMKLQGATYMDIHKQVRTVLE